MTARTIQTPAALRRDTRFQACSPGAKWVFGHLCDRREVVAEAGKDVLGTVALIVEGLGDVPRDVLAPLLLELERDRGLVTVEADRLVIHSLETPADRQGPRGGKSNAARQAAYRARHVAPVTVQPVTVTGSVTSRAPLLVVESNGSNGANRNVTDDVTAKPLRDGESNGFVGDGPSPEVLSPHSPLSPTPTQIQTTRAREEGPESDPAIAEKLQRLAALEALEADRKAKEAKREAKAAKRETRKQAAATDDAIPLPGTLAHRVYAAIVGDQALRPIVGHPGDFAARVTDPAAFPGVDVLAAVLDGAEYVARNPGKYTDGRAFLRNRLKDAAERERLRLKTGNPQASGVFTAPAFDRHGRPRAALPPSAREVIARQQASLSLPTKPEVPRAG